MREQLLLKRSEMPMSKFAEVSSVEDSFEFEFRQATLYPSFCT